MDNKNNIELDVKQALDNASLNDITKAMEGIDLKDFECPDHLSKKRIEKNVMGRIVKKNKVSKLKIAVSTAAAVFLIGGATLMISTDARAAVAKMFSFIPGRGVVEVDEKATVDTEDSSVTDANTEGTTTEGTTTEGATSEDKAATTESRKNGIDSDIYTLSKSSIDKVGGDKNLELTIRSATFEEGILSVEYQANLLLADSKDATDLMVRMDKVSDDEYYDRISSYYIDFGYDKYFDFAGSITVGEQIISNPKSVLKVDGKEYKPAKSSFTFGENSGGRIGAVRETYDLSDVSGKDLKKVVIDISGAKVSFDMEVIKEFETYDQALEGKNICERDGVAIICEPTWDGDTLRADFYAASCGEYKSVWDYGVNYMYTKDAPEGNIYVEVDGERIDAYVAADETVEEASDRNRAYTVYFDLAGHDTSEVEIHVPALEMVVDSEDVVIDVPSNGEMEFDINKGMVIPFADACEIMGYGDDPYINSIPSDYIYIETEESCDDKLNGFIGFSKTETEGNNMEEYDNFGAYASGIETSYYLSVVTEGDYSTARKLYLKDPIFAFYGDFIFNVTR